MGTTEFAFAYASGTKGGHVMSGPWNAAAYTIADRPCPHGESALNRRKFALVSAAIAFTACSDKAPTATAQPAKGANRPSDKEAYELAATGTGFTAVAEIKAQGNSTQATVYAATDAKPLAAAVFFIHPTSYLRPSSGPQGATILSAPNPAAAMTENENLVMQRKGGITVSPTLPDAVLDKVKANTALFQRLGAESVPYVLFKNPKTGAYGSHAGSTDTARLAQLVGA